MPSQLCREPVVLWEDHSLAFDVLWTWKLHAFTATHYTHIQIGSSRMNYSEKLSFALLDFDASVTTTYYNTSTGPHHPHPYYLMYTIPYLPLISSEGWIFYFKTLHMVCKRMPQNLGSPLRMKNPYPLFSFYSLHTLHWRVDKFSLIWYSFSSVFNYSLFRFSLYPHSLVIFDVDIDKYITFVFEVSNPFYCSNFKWLLL